MQKLGFSGFPRIQVTIPNNSSVSKRDVQFTPDEESDLSISSADLSNIRVTTPKSPEPHLDETLLNQSKWEFDLLEAENRPVPNRAMSPVEYKLYMALKDANSLTEVAEAMRKACEESTSSYLPSDALLIRLKERCEYALLHSREEQLTGDNWVDSWGRIFYNLKQFIGSSEKLDEFLQFAAECLADEQKPNLNGWASTSLLFGMENLTFSQGVEALLWTVASHLTQNKAKFKPLHNVRAFFGIRRFPDCEVVREVLNALLPHLKGFEFVYEPGELAQIFSGLQNKRDCSEVRAILQVLRTHLIAIKKELYLDDIKHITSGLKNFIDCPESEDILEELTLRVSNYHQLKLRRKDIHFVIYLAEIIYNLSDFLLNASQTTYLFINALFPKLDKFIDYGSLTTQNGQSAVIMELLHCWEGSHLVVDLRGTSHELAEYYLRATMESLADPNSSIESVRIICGRGKHRGSNKDVMKKIVYGVLQDNQSRLESQCDLKKGTGFVDLLRRPEVKNHTNDHLPLPPQIENDGARRREAVLLEMIKEKLNELESQTGREAPPRVLPKRKLEEPQSQNENTNKTAKHNEGGRPHSKT